MQQFTPEIWKMWQEKKQPVGTWFEDTPYHLPGGMPMLTINTTKPGLNNPKVRRALAHMIDYARIAETAMSRYSVPANASLILPSDAEKKFWDEARDQGQRRLEVRPGQGGADPGAGTRREEGRRRHLHAGRRHPARPVDGADPQRLDRLAGRGQHRRRELQGRRRRREGQLPRGQHGDPGRAERQLRPGAVLHRRVHRREHPVGPVPRRARHPRHQRRSASRRSTTTAGSTTRRVAPLLDQAAKATGDAQVAAAQGARQDLPGGGRR